MKNPTRRMRRTMGKIARGVAKVGQKVQLLATRAREAARSPLKRDSSLAREIVSRWLRQLLLTVVEVGISRLVRRITTRPKPANVTLLPTLRPAI